MARHASSNERNGKVRFLGELTYVTYLPSGLHLGALQFFRLVLSLFSAYLPAVCCTCLCRKF